MINNSGESPLESNPSPGLEQFNREMQNLDGENPLNFYDQLQKVGGDDEDLEVEVLQEGQQFEDLEPSEMMKLMQNYGEEYDFL